MKFKLAVSQEKSKEVEHSVALREYTEGTEVALSLNGRTYELAKKAGGVYKTIVTVDMFGYNGEVELSVRENGKTLLEQVYFPEEIFWDVP